jgi:hypothetical protein
VRPYLVVALLSLAGCDQVFGLDLSSEVSCPAAFDDLGYLVDDVPHTWPDAESACRAQQGPGGGVYTHLAVVTDPVEIGVIRRRIAGETWVGLSWIGLTDDARTRDDWAWITDEDTEPPAWELDQPNNSPPPQNCGQLTSTGFSDRLCAELRPYVCECDRYPVVLDRI